MLSELAGLDPLIEARIDALFADGVESLLVAGAGCRDVQNPCLFKGNGFGVQCLKRIGKVVTVAKWQVPGSKHDLIKDMLVKKGKSSLHPGPGNIMKDSVAVVPEGPSQGV